MGKTGEVTRGARPGAGDWSDWQPLVDGPAMSGDVLAETLDGGQAFRWKKIVADAAELGDWQGVWAENIVRLRRNARERIEWSAPLALAPRAAPALAEYFGTARDFSALTDLLPWRSDPHLARCVVEFSGLRILKQPFGETLLGFLCSATKQIVQIKQMMALLAERHGTPIIRVAERGSVSPNTPQPSIHRLPTWAELATIPETELRACQLGFRARYISETARWIAARPGWLAETEALPYAAAKERLCLLPGVGEKVADCVLLFGAGRMEAFPVDVWILKTLARRYGLDGWRPAQLTQFGRAHFGPLAGLAQQFLFAWERKAAKAARAAL
ncbi:MAG TPA: DNA glycosylase [Opitutaceae bacterium]|nr:DNA glycosylase [Opitutaceae bacterium]